MVDSTPSLQHDPCPNVTFWNCNSLSTSKFHQISALTRSSPRLLAVVCAETKHPSDQLVNHPNRLVPPGFKAIRKPFRSGSAGLVAFVRNSLRCRVRSDLSSSPHVLVLLAHIPGLDTPCLLGFAYRWPQMSHSDWSLMLDDVRRSSKQRLPVFWFGDWNARSADFGDSVTNSFGNDLSSCLDECGFTALNNLLCPNTPTRGESVLDICFTNEPRLVSALSTSGDVLMSDHRALSLSIAGAREPDKQPDDKPREVWNLSAAKWADFKKLSHWKARETLSVMKRIANRVLVSGGACGELAAPPLIVERSGDRPLSSSAEASPSHAAQQSDLPLDPQSAINMLVELLENLLLDTAKQTIPRKLIQPIAEKQTPAVVTKALHRYQHATRLYQRHKDDKARFEMNTARAAYLQRCHEWHARQANSKLQKLNDKGRINWKEYHSMLRAEAFPATAVSSKQDKLADSPKEALDTLAVHFAETCSLPADKLEPSEHLRAGLAEAERTPSSEDGVFELKTVATACKNLKKLNAAPGPDKIPARFLKHAGKTAIECLTFVLNFTWQHGVLPQRWREANVIPLYKESTTDRGDPNNYRPISLTSIICKLCERLVLYRLWKLVGGKISNRQFGFRAKHSTLDALMFLDHQVRIAFKAQKHMSVAFLDISKAFDRTWHAGLLYRLFQLGVSGRPWRWCRAFLTDRRLRTVENDLTSDWFSFNAGVPQGSVLSPFLFLVFINSVAKVVRGKAIPPMFADDIALVPTHLGKAGDEDLDEALARLDVWAKLWRVTFNAKKSKILCFTTKRKPPKIRSFFLAGQQLDRVPQFDYLGIRWQENGKWDAHIAKVSAAASRVAGFISSTLHRNGPPPSVIRHLCHALIRTKILYGMPVWKPTRAADWNRLDTIVADPMRKCLGLPKSTHLQSLLVETNTLSIRRQFDILSLTTCHRALKLPPDHQSRVVISSQLKWPSQARNRPIPVHAASICREYGAEKALADKPQLPPRKVSTSKALTLQRLDWRRADKGKRLQRLATLGPRMPEYLFYDPRPIAVIRARLRFDRAALAESRQRRGEVDIDINCGTCNEPDSLDHLLHECLLMPRDDLLREAAHASLPLEEFDLNHWVLGSVDLIDKKRRTKALDIGATFLLAAANIRKL
jgi:hypothetical protein